MGVSINREPTQSPDFFSQGSPELRLREMPLALDALAEAVGRGWGGPETLLGTLPMPTVHTLVRTYIHKFM